MGLPRPSQCSNSFWPSRGCGGSGLIFAVGVSVEKEMMSVQNPTSTKSSSYTLQLLHLNASAAQDAINKDLSPLTSVSKDRYYH